MQFLLDSQVLVWQKMSDSRLSLHASDLAENTENRLVISIVSFWELMIKESIGKLNVPGGVESLYQDWIKAKAADLLPVNWRHIHRCKDLPLIHRDPFDRMLIAQAMEENLTIVTCDENIPLYPGVATIW
jgi:PIN domain nuclease of toxin-antitoxin system